MKAVKRSGLVPVKFDADHRNHLAGEIAGVKPAEALRLTKAKIATLVPPEGETMDVDVEPTAIVVVETPPKKLVEIPENWEGEHLLQRQRLAAEIIGRKIVKADDADQIIRDELTRRARV